MSTDNEMTNMNANIFSVCGNNITSTAVFSVFLIYGEIFRAYIMHMAIILISYSFFKLQNSTF